jgi:hypothetical protein
MQVKLIIVIAAVAFAALTPVASAGPALDGGSHFATEPVPPAASQGSRFEDQAALRAAFEGASWQQANPAPVVAVTQPASSGFDWSSGIVGASVLLAFVLLVLAAVPALRAHRRRTTIAV